MVWSFLVCRYIFKIWVIFILSKLLGSLFCPDFLSHFLFWFYVQCIIRNRHLDFDSVLKGVTGKKESISPTFYDQLLRFFWCTVLDHRSVKYCNQRNFAKVATKILKRNFSTKVGETEWYFFCHSPSSFWRTWLVKLVSDLWEIRGTFEVISIALKL